LNGMPGKKGNKSSYLISAAVSANSFILVRFSWLAALIFVPPPDGLLSSLGLSPRMPGNSYTQANVGNLSGRRFPPRASEWCIEGMWGWQWHFFQEGKWWGFNRLYVYCILVNFKLQLHVHILIYTLPFDYQASHTHTYYF
jgi:hypothetical protein